MKSPLSHRNGIPFFCYKSAKDFQRDVYERYDEMVVRQSALHLADQLWKSYPMQRVLDFAASYYTSASGQYIAEVGCGVGRWIAHIAQTLPLSNCWGIDYSYQMLRRANEFWRLGKEVTIDLSSKGVGGLHLKGHQLSNLNFGLAKATGLPFADNSQDMIINSFLLDRLASPTEALCEMHRVLKIQGRLVVVTPLNFDQPNLWKTHYPPIKIWYLLAQIGFEILTWEEEMHIVEPLDAHGNAIDWKCLGFVAQKTRQ